MPLVNVVAVFVVAVVIDYASEGSAAGSCETCAAIAGEGAEGEGAWEDGTSEGPCEAAVAGSSC